MSRQASRFGAIAPKAQSLFFAKIRKTQPCIFATLMNPGHRMYPAILPILFSLASSIPIWHWRDTDRDISAVMSRYDLEHAELHTAWLLRTILEQSRIPDFDQLNYRQRRSAVVRHRTAHLLSLQKTAGTQKISADQEELSTHRRICAFDVGRTPSVGSRDCANRIGVGICSLIC